MISFSTCMKLRGERKAIACSYKPKMIDMWLAGRPNAPDVKSQWSA